MPDRTVEIPDSVKAEAAGELARMLCGCGDTELKPNPSTVAVAEDAVDLVAPILTAPLLRELEEARRDRDSWRRTAEKLGGEILDAESAETYTREEVERRLLTDAVIWTAIVALNEQRKSCREHPTPTECGLRAALAAAFPESQPTQDQKDGED